MTSASTSDHMYCLFLIVLTLISIKINHITLSTFYEGRVSGDIIFTQSVLKYVLQHMVTNDFSSL